MNKARTATSRLCLTAPLVLTLSLTALTGGHAQAQTLFQPGKLAVLQLGDGGPGRCLPVNGGSVAIPYTYYDASDILGARQTALYIDQYDPSGVNQTNAVVQVAVPTNGADGLFINGNAGTEGNMTLAGDRSVLAVTGYAGDLLSITTGQQTAPSNLSYDRGIGTIDAFGNYTGIYRGGGWYGIATGKTNPRGVATDGAGNFWGCGNGYGSLYFNAGTVPNPIQFQNIALTSCSKVINHTLYATVKSSESVNLYPAGVYSFVDFYNNPVPYPNAASFLHLEIPANSAHNNCIGFDIDPTGTKAYLADASVNASGGLTKYVKSGTTWNMAYHLAIPGYFGLTSGIMTNAGATNVLVGCFSVAVDWSGTNPVVYATTADSGVGSGSPYYGNRVIRINDIYDTNTASSSLTFIATTNILTTVVKPPGNGTSQLTNVVYKCVTFTPDLRPVITSQPASWSAVTNDDVSFSVVASSPYALSYQWLGNGTNLVGQTSATLTLNSVAITNNHSTFQCVVTNDYGAVTSSIATLTVTTSPQLPQFAPIQNLTNSVGNNQSITVSLTGGTDPKGGYQWFHNGISLSDADEYSGTATPTLTITRASTNDAGVYSAIVTNIAGSASNTVANFYTRYSAPVMIQPPGALTTFLGRTLTNFSAAYGELLSYQWYLSSKTTLSGATLTPLTEGAHYQGTTTPSLQINGAVNSDATNFVVTITNPGGAITSAPAPLTVIAAPAHTFVGYNGQAYVQNFNSLPIPGGSSAEGANPLHITYAMTNLAQMLLNTPYANANMAAELQYSTDNPMDFGFPIIPSGAIGGLGLSNSMAGWYGWAQNALVFAATKGDQSQGAVVDNGGIYYADGSPLSIITNRALGLIATTKTGPIAFGAALVNRSTKTYNTMNLSFTGELWRNNPNAQPLLFGYVIDPAGTNSTFQPAQWDSTNGINYLPELDVTFPTSSSTLIFDGTQPSNQVNRAVSNLPIANWPPGATLWLVWQAQTLGSAQNLAIDNVRFSASGSPDPTVIRVGSANYAAFDTTLTNGQWVYVDADPAAVSPVRATQRSLGYREVDYKKQVPPTLYFSAVSPTTSSGALVYDYSAQSATTNLVGFWAAKDVPMVIGPDGLAYITDGHHTTAGYLAASSLFRQIIPGQNRIILGHIVANYYNTNTGPVDVNDAWWTARAAENNAFLYGTNGDLLTLTGEPNYANLQPILPSVLPMPTTPSTLNGNGAVAMLASKYRGLTWGLADGIVDSGKTSTGAKIPGYKKAAPGSPVDLNFVEFYWADFLRNRILWDDTLSGSPYGSANGDASVTAAPFSFFTAVANGIALARSEAYRDEYGRLITAYTNSLVFPPITVNWAQGSISNGFAKATDTYHLFIRNDSTMAGDITPSASGSTNILHIDAATALTVTNLLQNFSAVIVNGGTTLHTTWKDATVPNSTLTLPAGTAAVIFNGAINPKPGGSLSLVVSNGTFGGNGVINGSVTVNGGATLAPGSSIGTLTVNGALTLNGTNVMEINKTGTTRTSDLLTGITTLTRGGNLTVIATGSALAAGDTFHLFTAGNYAGSFATMNLPALAAGLAWDTHNLGVNGNIAVVSTSAVSLKSSYSSGNLNLAWPSDHTGWRLEIQTNALSTGISTNWFTWPNSADTNAATIPVNPANPSVFLRLAFP